MKTEWLILLQKSLGAVKLASCRSFVFRERCPVFGQESAKVEPSSHANPAGITGVRAYAIGDIHGRLDLLDKLLTEIDRDDATRPQKETQLIFLGDLIDRGPHSKQVLDRVIELGRTNRKCIVIRGNHEASLLQGLFENPRILPQWLRHGGFETAESYGLSRGQIMSAKGANLQHLLLSAIPESHLKFLSDTVTQVRFGDYLFVHAGVRPGVPLDQQKPEDLMWIRSAFLESQADFGCTIVHGHTISETAIIRPNRIGIDTGAYRTGRLTALCIDEDNTHFIDAHIA